MLGQTGKVPELQGRFNRYYQDAQRHAVTDKTEVNKSVALVKAVQNMIDLELYFNNKKNIDLVIGQMEKYLNNIVSEERKKRVKFLKDGAKSQVEKLNVSKSTEPREKSIALGKHIIGILSRISFSGGVPDGEKLKKQVVGVVSGIAKELLGLGYNLNDGQMKGLNKFVLESVKFINHEERSEQKSVILSDLKNLLDGIGKTTQVQENKLLQDHLNKNKGNEAFYSEVFTEVTQRLLVKSVEQSLESEASKTI